MIETVIITNKEDVSNMIEEMNLQGSILISQQIPEETSMVNIKSKKERNVTTVTSNTKGIGINRKIALFFSSKSISILADDDLEFYDDYIEVVRSAYEELPQADMIIFDLDGRKSLSKKKKPKRVSWYNYMRYGAARFTFKKDIIIKKGITFNNLFGASIFGSGEDTLFLKDCLDKNLKIYYYPKSLAFLKNSRKSTWFKSYNLKYYFDKGALFKALSPNFYKLLLIRHIIKTKNYMCKEISITEAYKNGVDGANFYKRIGENPNDFI